MERDARKNPAAGDVWIKDGTVLVVHSGHAVFEVTEARPEGNTFGLYRTAGTRPVPGEATAEQMRDRGLIPWEDRVQGAFLVFQAKD